LGTALTVTVALADELPEEFEQVILYVVVCVGATDGSIPNVGDEVWIDMLGLLPTCSIQLVAFVDDHDNNAFCPTVMVVGLANTETVGTPSWALAFCANASPKTSNNKVDKPRTFLEVMFDNSYI
jgi:hypothetical protein